MQVGDSLVGVDHGQSRTLLIGSDDIRLNFGFLFCRKLVQFANEITESVFKINPESSQCVRMLADKVLEVGFHPVTENNRVGHLHHGRLHVQGEKNALFLGPGNLLFKKVNQGGLAHDGPVQDFPFQQRQGFLQCAH